MITCQNLLYHVYKQSHYCFSSSKTNLSKGTLGVHSTPVTCTSTNCRFDCWHRPQTKCLVENGFHNVTAVEPAENMRLKLKEILPKVTCLPGTSWDIPVKDQSCDAVVIAQAFHWFDDSNTLKELHRVLSHNGHVILAWNLESAERSDWVAKIRK